VGEDRTTPSNASAPTSNQRLSVHEAARKLGVSEDAVRMRVKRGTLKADKEGGRLYVLLETEPTTEPTDRTNELIAELRDRVRSLESQLGEEREANRENRRIIAALTSRIPELEPAAPQEPSQEAPETATEQPGRVGPQPAVESPQEGSERPWWRRWFRA
jgi:hypothetical protein